jgi:ABC-type branched-subunit amino acid transport system ATPase component/ABC-type branched-subunit amino acid transport system permease subunit
VSRRTGIVELVLLGVLFAFPWVPGASGLLGSVNQAAVYTVVAASLVLLTGWVGQISLAQAALVGVGAYATGWASGTLGLPFPLNLPIGAGAAGLVAILLGFVALRVRGLYLAVATLVFSWAASEFLFRQSWVLDHGIADRHVVGGERSIISFDFSDSRLAFYYAAWGTAVIVLYALTNLRDSKTGRAFFAIRGSEVAAASLGMNVLRYKALAFAMSGALAGVAGNLVITHARVVSADAFTFNQSMFFLAIAVVGGITSLGGAVSASFLFASLGEVFFRFPAVSSYLQLVSTGLLAVTFRLYPGGIARLASTVSAKVTVPAVTDRVEALRARLRTRRRLAAEPLLALADPAVAVEDDEEPVAERLSLSMGAPIEADVARGDRRILIEARDVLVQFGGLTAVKNASLTVREGEIVGLIGPNGAGKTTTFELLAGFTHPDTGRVWFDGADVSGWTPEARSAAGLVRSFQDAALFATLTVHDILVVALEASDPTTFVAALLGRRTAERRRAAAADEVLDRFGLRPYRDRRIQELSTGTRRITELACLVAQRPTLLLLDEPAAGVAQRETERLGDVLRGLRDELGLTIVVIEHDIPLIMGLADRVVAMDGGVVIADGPPAEVRADPRVATAYLGGDPVAVARSGALQPA